MSLKWSQHVCYRSLLGAASPPPEVLGLSDNGNDPVGLFVLQFVLQFSFYPERCLWLGAATRPELTELLNWVRNEDLSAHLWGALGSRSHSLSCEKNYTLGLFVRAQLSISIRCLHFHTHLQYKKSDSTFSVPIPSILFIQAQAPLYQPNSHSPPSFPAGSLSSDLSHSEPHEWTIVPFSGAPWP